MTPETLARAVGLTQAAADAWAGPISRAMEAYGVSTPARQAMFLAHCGHETDSFSRLEENLNYSAARLAAVWPNRFAEGGQPNALALRLHRKPEAIANVLYANRMGNGTPESGDGWRYRGRGLPQLTGKANYQGFAKASPLSQADPDMLTLPVFAAHAGGWFWQKSNMNAYADIGALEAGTRRWNGGLNGIEDRRARYMRALAVLQ